MENNNSYELNYYQIKKIIKKYYLALGKKVKVKIFYKRVFEGELNPHVDPIIRVTEPKALLVRTDKSLTKVKIGSNWFLSEDELEKIINNFLENNGRELLSLTSNVSFKKIISSPNKDYCSLYSKKWLTDKTFTIYFKQKTINNDHPTVIKPSKKEIIQGIEDEMSINSESGLELAQKTSETLKFEKVDTMEYAYKDEDGAVIDNDIIPMNSVHESVKKLGKKKYK